MKLYHCDVCESLIYFENTQCLSCRATLGYLPVLDAMTALEKVDEKLWHALVHPTQKAKFKKCLNYELKNVCNWMIPVDDPDDFCLSCRLNDTIPDLTVKPNIEYWYRLEKAKRRLIYSLLRLRLPLKSKSEDPKQGLAFDFLADKDGPDLEESEKVMIGHEQGKITINIAEANDAIREKMRLDMNERYRTLIGHFRHEIGHYYWFLLIESSPELLEQYRMVFGDERVRYDKALKSYYAEGPRADWQDFFLNPYASSHPWEDWAESWAHYLHMLDTLETAYAWGVSVSVQQQDKHKFINPKPHTQSFDKMRDQWLYLSGALNSLNRSMGMKDIYPFVWSDAVVEKLRFVQKVMKSAAQT